jgi:hypothetical protein
MRDLNARRNPPWSELLDTGSVDYAALMRYAKGKSFAMRR